ncbi:MAG: membrane protein [Pirellulaceae bacterium]|nr:MAG: membrane protein [Pirellulaceae bacterium]
MARVTLAFQWTWITLVVAVVAVAVVAIVGWMAWRRSGYRPAILVLESLRVAVVALAALLLNQPEAVEAFRPPRRPQIAILADQTRSMQTPDVRLSTSSTDPISRLQAILPWTEAEAWRDLSPKFDVSVTKLGEKNPDRTDLASALESIHQSHRDLRAVVVLSDGDWNAGQPPVEAAWRLRMAGVPVFAVTVGSSTRLPDLEIVGFDVPSFGIVGKAMRIPFRIDSALPYDHPSVVRLYADDTIVVEQPIEIAAMGGTTDSLTWSPQETGKFTLKLEVATHPEEAVTDNNVREAPIAVRRENLRVLVIESVPRWEYRYLRNALSRDPGVDVDCLLYHPELTGVGGGSRDYLPAFPEQLDVLQQYDVVFLGDVGRQRDQLSTTQCQLLRGLVEQQASGLVFIPGPRGYEHSLLDSPLEPLLPVVLDREQPRGIGAITPQHFALTQAGRRSLLTRLADTDQENTRVWGTLPGFQWHAATVRAKAGTEVLAVHQQTANQYGRIPLLVTRPFGAGKVLFMGMDGAWRWRRGVEDLYHYRFWGQVVRWMAYQRSMAKGSRMRFYYAPEQPMVAHAVTMNVNVMDRSGEPVQGGDVRVNITAPSGSVETIHLQHRGDQWGLFSGQFIPSESGSHAVQLVCAEAATELSTELYVHGTEKEPIGRPARPEVLEELAHAAGGQVLAVDQLDQLRSQLFALPDPPPEERRLLLWCHPAVALTMIALLAAFWAARKYVGLF